MGREGEIVGRRGGNSGEGGGIVGRRGGNRGEGGSEGVEVKARGSDLKSEGTDKEVGINGVPEEVKRSNSNEGEKLVRLSRLDEDRGGGSPIPPAGLTPNSANLSTPTVVALRNRTPEVKVQAASEMRLRSTSANSAVRRVSMDLSLISRQNDRQNDRLLHEKKRRRWSLNTPNHLNNLPQVSLG